MFNNKVIAVIGLGYVGLPLAIAFGKTRDVIGYDKNPNRIKNLINGHDETRETSKSDLTSAKFLKFSNDLRDISKANVFIVTVPTPIDKNNKPDLSLIIEASTTIGKRIKSGDVVIYESTVYPGVTEEICVPILEEESKLKYNQDFFCGYSPERINPGDKNHRLEKIVKVTSGSTNKIAIKIDCLYKSIIKAGTYRAPSIKIAEAAKVIENTQRDVNIALMNELSLIFNKMNIDTHEVLKAAETKWNFLRFKPGLVGGHCIGVDPYYLTFKAQELGYKPEIILSGRKINDNMGRYIANKVVNLMEKNKFTIDGSKALVLGYTFKENCPDIRNSKVLDIINILKSFNIEVDVFDPWVSNENENLNHKLNFINKIPKKPVYSAIIIAVAHNIFKNINIKEIRNSGKPKAIIYDVKGVFNLKETSERL